MKKLYLQLNEVGSGSISIPRGTQAAADAIAADYIDLDYNGLILGGFIPEHIERIPIIETENAGRMVNLSGRGPMAVLDYAIVWDWGTPALEKERYFNTAVGGDDFTTPMHHKGHILHVLLNEAMTYQDNPALDIMDRKCFHNSSGTHMLSWAFNADDDTDGTPWDVVEDEDLRARVGSTILELARQYSALGQPTAEYVFDIHAVHEATGVIKFHIHQTPTGILAANAVVHFRQGGNVITASDVEDKTGVRNAALVAYTDPVYPYIEVSVPASITEFWRREEVIETYNAETDTQAGKFGLAELAGISDSTRVITIKATDIKAPHYGIDYNLGDWVYYEEEDYDEILVRIMSMSLEWDDDVPLSITMECMA